MICYTTLSFSNLVLMLFTTETCDFNIKIHQVGCCLDLSEAKSFWQSRTGNFALWNEKVAKRKCCLRPTIKDSAAVPSLSGFEPMAMLVYRSVLRGSGYLGHVDSNQGYNPHKWVICPLTRVINLHITSY